VLKASGSIELIDMAAHRAFRGVHFGSIEKAAADYVKKGLVSMTGTKLSLKEAQLDERQSGGEAFGKAWNLWGKNQQDLLVLATQLRVALEVVKKTPGYSIDGGPKNRPGKSELESGLKHLTAALRDLRVGFSKMSETTFLEDWDEDNDGLGLDDKKKRKKPTDLKSVEAEKAKKDKKAAKAAPEDPEEGDGVEEEVRPGTYFVLVDVSVAGGKMVQQKLFHGAKAADAAAEKYHKAGRRVQVLDALWYEPARAMLKAGGMIGESDGVVSGLLGRLGLMTEEL